MAGTVQMSSLSLLEDQCETKGKKKVLLVRVQILHMVHMRISASFCIAHAEPFYPVLQWK